MPAKRMVDAVSFSGRISSYPVFMKGVALPHKAQQSKAKQATTNVLVKNVLFFVSITIPISVLFVV